MHENWDGKRLTLIVGGCVLSFTNQLLNSSTGLVIITSNKNPFAAGWMRWFQTFVVAAMSLSPLSCYGTHFICNNLIGCYGYDDNLIPDIASEVSRSLDTPQFLVPRLLPSSPADDIGWARCSKRLFQQFSQFKLKHYNGRSRSFSKSGCLHISQD